MNKLKEYKKRTSYHLIANDAARLFDLQPSPREALKESAGSVHAAEDVDSTGPRGEDWREEIEVLRTCAEEGTAEYRRGAACERISGRGRGDQSRCYVVTDIFEVSQ